MNIAPVTSVNFGMKTIFRLPLKTGETAKIFVSESNRAKETGITEVAYEIWKKGKITEQNNFVNKNGMDHYDFAEIVTKIDARAKEGFEFFKEYSRAYFKNLK